MKKARKKKEPVVEEAVAEEPVVPELILGDTVEEPVVEEVVEETAVEEPVVEKTVSDDHVSFGVLEEACKEAAQQKFGVKILVRQEGDQNVAFDLYAKHHPGKGHTGSLIGVTVSPTLGVRAVWRKV